MMIAIHSRLQKAALLLPLSAGLLAGCGEGGSPAEVQPGLRITLDTLPEKFVTCGGAVPLTARARTERGAPVAGLAAHFTVEAGGGRVAATTVVTDAQGIARASWTLGSEGNVVNAVSVDATDPVTGADSTYATQTATTRTRLAFTSRLEGNRDIYAMDPDGGGRVRLTTHPADDRAPAWSPSGDRIAFTSERDADSEVYLMDASGRDQTNLTNNPGFDYGPKWSHDGRRIAFTRSWDVYVMDAAGTSQVDLTGDDGDLVWSPDGGSIAFTGHPSAGGGVYVIRADGSGLLRVAADPEASAIAWSGCTP